MLRSLRDVDRYTIVALDGNLGGIVDLLFDLDSWGVHHFVVATGRALCGREVLVSTVALCELDWEGSQFFLATTLDSFGDSHLNVLERTLSNQDEPATPRYFSYLHYKDLEQSRRSNLCPPLLVDVPPVPVTQQPTSLTDGTELHSARKLQGYRVEGSDGTLGHIEDFIVDDETRQLRYFVVKPQVGTRILMAAAWTERVDWDEGTVDIDISLLAIEGAPEWHQDAAVAREYELRFFKHYGRAPYWDSDDRPTLPPPSGRPQFHSVKPVLRSRPLTVLSAERDRARC